jgi:hypothetical protein
MRSQEDRARGALYDEVSGMYYATCTTPALLAAIHCEFPMSVCYVAPSIHAEDSCPSLCIEHLASVQGQLYCGNPLLCKVTVSCPLCSCSMLIRAHQGLAKLQGPIEVIQQAPNLADILWS